MPSFRDQFGDTEDRYMRALLPVCYHFQGRLLGYGLKFWPGDLASLQKENPQLAWLTEGLK